MTRKISLSNGAYPHFLFNNPAGDDRWRFVETCGKMERLCLPLQPIEGSLHEKKSGLTTALSFLGRCIDGHDHAFVFNADKHVDIAVEG